MSILGDLKNYLRKAVTALSKIDTYFSRMDDEPEYMDDYIEGLIAVSIMFQQALRKTPSEISQIKDQLKDLNKRTLRSKELGVLDLELLTDAIALRNQLNSDEISDVFEDLK